MALIPHSHADRMAAQATKRRRLLAWLRLEIWTTPAIAGDVMGVTDRRTIRDTLAAMSRDGLIALDEIEIPLGVLKVLGITMDGQSAAAGLERDMIGSAYERGRIGLTVLDHTLDLQTLKLSCLRAGWKNWNKPDSKKWGKAYRPDAIAVTPDGVVVCIECERTIKTKKRYATIFSNHVTGLGKKAFSHVIYAAPTPEKARNIERLLRSIHLLQVAGETVSAGKTIDAHFTFVTYENIHKLNLKETRK